jgi:hypothetical protein
MSQKYNAAETFLLATAWCTLILIVAALAGVLW